MPLSSMPSVGPSLPAGCTNVKVKTSASDPAASRVDVTTLSDVERVYEAAPLVDAADDGQQTVVAQFFGVAPAVNTSATATGWVCIDVETEYAVGEMVKGTATYVYKAATPV